MLTLTFPLPEILPASSQLGLRSLRARPYLATYLMVDYECPATSLASHSEKNLPLHTCLTPVPCLVFSPVQLFAIPQTAIHQAPLSMGILQARRLEWVAYPFSRGSPHPEIEPVSPALQADSLPAELPGKPCLTSRDDLLSRYYATCTKTKGKLENCSQSVRHNNHSALCSLKSLIEFV